MPQKLRGRGLVITEGGCYKRVSGLTDVRGTVLYVWTHNFQAKPGRCASSNEYVDVYS